MREELYYKLAEVPGVARKIKKYRKKSIYNYLFLAYITPGIPLGFLKKTSQFDAAIWSAIADK